MNQQNYVTGGRVLSTDKTTRRCFFAILIVLFLSARGEAGLLTVPGDHPTIQGAIDAASPGDTILVGAGTFEEDVTVNKTVSLRGAGVGQTVVSGPIGGGFATIRVTASHATVSHFTITREGNNPDDWNGALNSAGISLHSPGMTGVLIHDVLVTGMRTGIDINNTGNAIIRGTVIDNNRTGMILRNQTDNLVFEENKITNNWTVGILFLDASGGSNTPVQQAQGTVFRNNDISGNWYGQIVDRQTGGSLPAAGANPKDFSNNWLGTLAPVITTVDSSEPGYADQIPVAFGGDAVPPSDPQPDFAGSASANIDFLPLLASGVDTDIETVPGRGTYGFQGDLANVDGPVKNITGPGDPILYPNIATAIADATPGDTILLGAGSFAENVTTTFPLTIEGSGPGTIIAPTSGTGVVLAAGNNENTRSVLRNLSVLGNGSANGIVAGGYTTIENVTSSGHTNYGISLNQGVDLVIIDSHFDQNRVGLKLGSTVSFSELVISGSSFDENTEHGWYSDANKTIQPTLENVSISNTSFRQNGLKGFYTERLSDAIFDGIVVTGNANRADFDHGAGVDINLKWRAFENITVQNSTFENNGNGSANGVALAIKARDDAPSYSSPAASLNEVLVENCQFNDNERHFVAGEPGKSNAGPTEVVLRMNSFGASTSEGVVSHSTVGFQATHNFWGTSNPNFAPLVSEGVSFSPWYADAGFTRLVTAANFILTAVTPDLTVGSKNKLPTHKGRGVFDNNPNRQQASPSSRVRSKGQVFVGLANHGEEAGEIALRAGGLNSRLVRTRILETGPNGGNQTAKMQRGNCFKSLNAGEAVVYRVVKNLTLRGKRGGRRVTDRTVIRSHAGGGMDSVSAMMKFRPR